MPVTPGAFNRLLRRVVVATGDSCLDGSQSLPDRPAGAAPTLSLARYPHSDALAEAAGILDAIEVNISAAARSPVAGGVPRECFRTALLGQARDA